MLSSLQREVDNWIRNHLNQFHPVQGDDISRVRWKAFSELALYQYVATEIGSEPVPVVESFVHDFTNDQLYLNRVSESPNRILIRAFPLATSDIQNTLSKEGVQTLQNALETPRIWEKERAPHEELELWHLCQLAGYNTPSCRPDEFVPKICAGQQFDIIESTWDEAYDLTHTVLYYHNFGVPHPGFPPNSEIPNFHDVLFPLICRHLYSERLDVSLELIAAGILENSIPRPYLREALGWVCHLASIDDVYSAPEHIIDNMISSDIEQLSDDKVQWLRRYHTYLVAGIVTRICDHYSISAAEPEANMSEMKLLGGLLSHLNRQNWAAARTHMQKLQKIRSNRQEVKEVYECCRERFTKQLD